MELTKTLFEGLHGCATALVNLAPAELRDPNAPKRHANAASPTPTPPYASESTAAKMPAKADTAVSAPQLASTPSAPQTLDSSSDCKATPPSRKPPKHAHRLELIDKNGTVTRLGHLKNCRMAFYVESTTTLS
ncbi:hypothetical protein HGRIS_000042 [Hohenbuehelia grisea]|uniref:Uncharacterized protein n=1 Tax=Hohenbuehelia grisea TaxID=104357 RepID=A0ABR3JPW1_9AGAR